MSGMNLDRTGSSAVLSPSHASAMIRHRQHTVYISNQKVSSVVTGDAAAYFGVTWPRQISRRHVSTTAASAIAMIQQNLWTPPSSALYSSELLGDSLCGLVIPATKIVLLWLMLQQLMCSFQSFTSGCSMTTMMWSQLSTGTITHLFSVTRLLCSESTWYGWLDVPCTFSFISSWLFFFSRLWFHCAEMQASDLNARTPLPLKAWNSTFYGGANCQESIDSDLRGRSVKPTGSVNFTRSLSAVN
jgi:hypothetical protein